MTTKKMKVGFMILMLLFCMGQTFAAICGDVDSDDSVDIIDALIIAQDYVGLPVPDFDAAAADVNGDGAITIIDALRIAQYYVGINTQLSCIMPTPMSTPGNDGPNSMGYCGCSMAQNVADGYRAVGGRRMWGGYGTGGMVVQNWTDSNSSSWRLFDQQTDRYGEPSAVWVQICIFPQGATYDEVKRMIAAAREHAAPGATIYITGQPLYPEGNVCTLAGGADGPASTDRLAQQAANDPSLNVVYPGMFTLRNSEVLDGCHANSSGERALGNQAVDFFGN